MIRVEDLLNAEDVAGGGGHGEMESGKGFVSTPLSPYIAVKKEAPPREDASPFDVLASLAATGERQPPLSSLQLQLRQQGELDQIHRRYQQQQQQSASLISLLAGGGGGGSSAPPKPHTPHHHREQASHRYKGNNGDDDDDDDDDNDDGGGGTTAGRGGSSSGEGFGGQDLQGGGSGGSWATVPGGSGGGRGGESGSGSGGGASAVSGKMLRKRGGRVRGTCCSFPDSIAAAIKARRPDGILLPRPDGISVLRRSERFEERLVEERLRLNKRDDRKARPRKADSLVTSADTAALAALLKQLRNYGMERSETDVDKPNQNYNHYRFAFDPKPPADWYNTDAGIDGVAQGMLNFFLQNGRKSNK